MRPGVRLAHLDRTGPEVIELLFAVSKIGAVVVPLSWRLTVDEVAGVAADSRGPILVAGFAETAGALAAGRQPPLVVEVVRSTRRGSPPTTPSTRAGAARRAMRSSRCTRPARPASRRVS